MNHFSPVGPLIHRPESMPDPGPYFPSLVDLSQFSGVPFDAALYFSTDHHGGEGGVYAYFCRGSILEASNWISYDGAVGQGLLKPKGFFGSKNPLFLDEVQGNGHTETPHANVVEGKVFLTYHKNNIPPTQKTLLATSEDVISFERVNGKEDSVILSYEPKTSYGDGHTGYFRWAENPFSGVDAKYVGYSLHGGGNDFFSAFWISENGEEWERKNVLKPIEGWGVEDPDMMITWHGLDPSSIEKLEDGSYCALCDISTRSSGADARKIHLAALHLAEDGVTLLSPVKVVLKAEKGLDSEEVATSTSLGVKDGVLEILYIGTTEEASKNTIMGAKGSWPIKEWEPLPKDQRQLHLIAPDR